MATYVNDLRLKEISTGDESGTWGTSTNTNLELIGEALGYATQQVFSSDADATTTVADGASDPARAMYFKITSAGSLTATRTCTIAPNTVSRVMFIENATTGSQSIAISQGSGANVTIATGKTAVVYLDGAGSGAAVVDAMAGVDPGVTDTLTEVLVAGNTSGGTNIELSTTDKVQFRDAAIYINSSADGQLDIVADTEIQIAATTVDLNGNLDVSGTTVSAGKITADAGIDIDNINIDGTTIALSSGDLTLDVAGDIILDADTGVWRFKDAGTTLYQIAVDGASVVLYTGVSDADMVFKGNDGGSTVTALTLDMSAAGAATFNSSITIPDWVYHSGDSNTYFGFPSGDEFKVVTANIGRLHVKGSESVWNEGGEDIDFRVESDTNANMLIVDASSNHVNIGTGTDLNGVLNVDGNLSLSGAGTSNRYVALLAETSTYAGTLMLQAGGGSSAYGAAVVLHGHSHATNPGMLYLAGSAGAGGKGVVIGRNGISVTAASEMLTAYSNGAELVINEFGNNQDFRVESDSSANMLVVDGAENKVGINRVPNISNSKLEVGGADNVPIFNVEASGVTGGMGIGASGLQLFHGSSSKLAIASDGSATFGGSITATAAAINGQLNVTGTTNSNNIFASQLSTQFDTSSFLRLHPNTVTDSGGFTNIFFGTSTTNNYGVAVGGKRAGTDNTPSFAVRMLNDSTIGTEVLNITNAGEVTKPYQPAFCCKPSGAQNNMATGGVTIAFGSELFDIGANYASNTFTAPVTGKYFLNFSVRLDQVPTDPTYIEVKIMTSNNTFHWLFDPDGFDSSPSYFNAQNSVVCDMDANDTAYIQFNQSGGTVQVDCATESHFSGNLVC